jgi:hypothetical protein
VPEAGPTRKGPRSDSRGWIGVRPDSPGRIVWHRATLVQDRGPHGAGRCMRNRMRFARKHRCDCLLAVRLEARSHLKYPSKGTIHEKHPSKGTIRGKHPSKGVIHGKHPSKGTADKLEERRLSG